MHFLKYTNRQRKPFSLLIFILAGVVFWGWSLRSVFAQANPTEIATRAAGRQINVSAILLDAKGSPVSNGEYQVRFSIYRADRNAPDPYPSNADISLRVWEEVQTVVVKEGVMTAYLGAAAELPGGLTFSEGDYFLGIRIGTDSEMVPRKKFGTFTNAINSDFLRGRSIGSKEGDIATIGANGKFDISQLPVGTSGKKLLLANNSDFQGVLDDVKGLQGDAHTQNTDTGTNSLIFNIGSSSSLGSNSFDFSVSNAANAPTLRFNSSVSEWQYSNDGTTFTSFGSGLGGLTGTGTNGYAAYWTGAGTLGSEQYLSTVRGGTGLDTSASTGVPTISSGAWSIASNLDVSLGGTGLTSVPSNGQLLIGNGSGYTLAGLTAGDGVAVATGSGSISLAVDASTVGTTSTLQSNSGIESTASGIRLLGGCSDGQLLKWDSSSSVWVCSGDLGGATAIINVKEGVATYPGVDTLNFDPTDFSVSQLGSEASLSVDYANSGITREGQDETISGAWTFVGDATFGSIVGGTWNGTAIGASYGGTGINTSGSTGVPYISSGTWSVDATALSTAHGGTGATSLNNLITLGTHTTGNYVATITAGNGISGSASSEGATPTLSVNLLTSADGAGSTSSNSGLEFQGGSDDALALLQGCSDNQILSWNDATDVWYCASVSGVGGVTGSGSGNQVAYWTGASTLAGENQLSVSRGGTGIGSYAIGDLLVATGATTLASLDDVATGNVLLSGGVGIVPGWGKVDLTTHVTGTLPVANGGTGATSLNNLITLGTHTTGNYVATITAGNGISGSASSEGATPTLSVNLLTSADGTGAVSSNSGLEFQGGSGSQLSLLQGCSDSQILSWDDTTSIWYCSDISGVGGVTGSGSGNQVAYWTGASTLAGENQLSVSRGGTGIGSYVAGDLIIATDTTTLSALSDIATGNVLISGGVGVAPSWGKVNLVTHVTGTLPIANGGTGANLSDPNADRILFWDDSGGAVDWLSLASNLSITTTSLDLSPNIQLGSNGTDGTLSIYSEQGATDYTTIFQPGTQTQSVTYTLPNDDGDASQVLVTNGSGTLSWQSVSGVGALDGTGSANAVAYWVDNNTLTYENQLSLSRGGTGANLSDPNADRILFWDDSGGAVDWLSLASNLSITTTSLDLSPNIQLGSNGTDGTLSIYSEQGATDYTTIFQPGTQTQSVTYTLPNDDGDASQVLVTNGSGTLSWQSVSGVGALDGTGSANAVAYWVDNNTLTYENQLSLSRGGTGANLSDPNADRILFWDDSGGAVDWLSLASNLSITTTSLDLSPNIQLGSNGTDGTLSIYSEQGATDYTTIFQPGTQTQSVTYTLPNDDGSSGQVLITDGSGALSWSSISGAGGVSGTGTNGYVSYWTGTSSLGAEQYLSTARGGTGINTSASTGVPTLSGGTWSIAASLSVSLGGIGTTTLTSNGVLYGNGTGAVQVTTPGTDGQLLLGVTSGAPVFSTMSGDATITNAGVLTIASNAVALTTDTTGNYVQSITNGNGISGGDGGSEGAALTLSLNLLTSADGTGNTSSNSGLEFQGGSSNQLTLLQGCANNEVLSWNDSTNVWYCASISGVGGLTGSGSSGQVAYWSGTSSLAGENQLSVSRGGTGIGSYTIGDLLIATGATTLAALNDVATGNVLISGGVGVAPSWGKVNLAAHVTGTLPVANGGTGATSLTDLITLTTHTTGNYVQSITNGNGISGGDGGSEGAALTIALGALTGDWNQTGAYDVILNNASSELKILESSGATYYGIFDVTDLSSNDKTYTFPNATGTVVLGTGSLNGVAYWTGANSLTSEAQLSTSRGGTGQDSSAWSGVPYVSSGTWNVSSQLSLSRGGTGANLSDPNADRILFWDDSGGAVDWLSLASNLSITTTSIDLSPNIQLGSNGTDGTLSIYSEQGATDYTTIFQPGTQTQSVTYTLPNDDGSSGQVLITDGSGALSWSSISGAGGVSGTGTNGYVSYWTGTSSLGAEQYLSTARGGTGINTSASTGVPTLSGGTWSIAASLSVSLGGIGTTTLTSNGVLYGNGTGAVQATTPGTNGQLLLGVTSGIPVFSTMSGDATITNAGVLTIASNAVALTTDTTGNYVQSITNGNGISGGDGGSEGAALTLSLNLLTSADGTGNTSSNSGLEFQGGSSNQLTLLQGCANNEVLSWNDSTNVWYCASISGVGGLTGSGSSGQVAYWNGTSSLAGENQLSLSRGGTGANLSDPNADRILFWDDSGGAVDWLSLASNLSITTTSLDLSPNIQLGSNGTDGTLSIYSEQGATDYTTIFQPGTQTQSVTYTLPNDDGDASQVLVTNGSGTLSWQSVSGVGALDGTGSANAVAYWIDGNTLTYEAQLSISRGGTGATSLSDLITLTTHTTGNYVQSITNGNGISGGDGGSEGAALTLSLNLLTSADGTGNTSSNSGLEFQGGSSNQLTLLQGCANNEVLSWNDSTNVWYCASISGVGGLTGSGSSGQVAYWNGTSSLAGENQLSVSRGGTGIGSYTIGDLLIATGATTLAALNDVATGNVLISGGVGVAPSWGKVNLAAHVTGTLPVANGGTGATSLTDLITLTTHTTGNYVQSITNGNGISGGDGGSEGAALTLSLNLLTSADGTGNTSSNSGLEFQGGSSNQLTLLQGCSDGQVLSWNDATNVWECADKTAGTSDWTAVAGSPNFTYLTDTTGNLVLGGSTLTSARFILDVSTGNQILFEGTGADDANETTLVITNPTADRTLTLPDLSGTLALLDGGQTFTSAVWNATAIGAQYGGTGINTSASTGVPYISSGTWSVDATALAVAHGGTGATSLSDLITLTTHTTGNYVQSITNGNGISGGDGGSEGAALTLSLNLLTSADGTGNTSSNSGLEFQGGSSNQLTLLQGCANNEVLSWNDSTNVWYCASISGVGGLTGSGSSGQVAYWSGTSSLAGENQLSVSRGGTGASSVGSLGSISYSNGSAYAFSAVGTTGQALISGGGGSPTWYAPTIGSILFAGASGALSQDNANLFWDNTNNRLGLGTAVPGQSLAIAGDTAATLNAGYFASDGILLAQLSDGVHLGSVGVRENQFSVGNAGVNWTARDSSRVWTGVAMSSDGKIQTTGVDNGQIYTSSDYGATWTARDSSRVWWNVALSSDGKIQTAVVYGGQIYTSSDYGATWTARDSIRIWSGIALSSDGRIQTAVVNAGQIYTSSDYGATWTARDSSRNWFDIAMSSDGKIQTATDSGGQVYTSSDYGATWTARDSSRTWRGVALSSDGKIQTATVGSGGQIYTSSDYGATWTARDSSRDWQGISLSSDGKIQTAAAYSGQLYTSSDYGATWTARDSSRGWLDVAMSSDGKIQTAVDNNSGNIYTSYADSTLPAGALVVNDPSATVKIMESSGLTYYGILDVADLSADRTYTLPNATGTIITTGNLTSITATGTIASGVWNGTAIGAQYGGTGINTSASTGVPYISSGTWSVDATALAVAHGGTGATSLSDLITLTTHTTGNYVQSITNGNGISGGDGGSEGAALTLSLNLLTSADGTGNTSSNSGLEFQGGSSNQLTLLQGCSDGQVLSWNDATNVWECADKTAGTSDWTAVAGSPNFTYLTDTTGNLVLGGSTLTSARFILDVSTGNQILFEGTGADDANETTLVITNPTADRTLTLPDLSGTLALLDGGQTFTSAVWNATAIGAQYGGTGINTSASTGVPYISSGTWSVDATALAVAHGGTGATSLSDLITLTTHTTGNYVANVSTSALTGLTGGSAGSEGASLSLALDYSATLAGDPSLSASAAVFASTGLIFEGTTADTIEGLLTVADPTSADKTWTLPNATGTIITTGNLTSITATGTIASGIWNGTAIGAQYGGTGINTSASTGVPYISSGTWSVDATALAVAHGGTGATSLSDLITLTTHTTGNYVQSITNGNGISGGDGGSEGAALTLSLNLLTSADGTGNTSSNSGLEFQGGSSNQLTLLQGCSDGQLLSWNDSTNLWACTTVVSSSTLQSAYGGDVDGSNTTIALTSADDSLIFSNPTSAGTDSAYVLFLNQQNTTAAVVPLSITQASNAANGISLTANSIDGETGIAVTANALTSGSGLTLASSATAFTGNMESITLSGNNVSNTGDLLELTSSGASSIARALYVSVASTGNLSATGGVGFSFTGAHTGPGFAMTDATQTGTGFSLTTNSLTSGTGFALASSASALTGSLESITLSGSNANNTGSLLAVNNTGTLNANTSLYVKHYATGTGNLAFRVDDVSSDTSPFVIDGSGYVGIGTSAPVSGLEVYDSAADPIFTVTGAHNTDYDPQIQFRTDATPTVKFSLGVDAADDAFHIYSGTGVGGTSEFSIDTSGVTSINQLQTGAQIFEDNAGVVSWIDLGVTSSAPDNTVESYSAQIDGTSLLTVYALSDGAGSIDNKGIGIGTSAPGYMLDVLDDTASDYATRIFNDGDNANRYGLVIQAGADDASGTTYYLNALDGNGDQIGYIANTSGTFALTDPSDIRTKTNVRNTIESGLDIINQLRVVDFNRLSNPDGPMITGFIAQEVQSIYPKVISVGEDGILGLSKSEFIPIIVKAIQEESVRTSNIESTLGILNLSTGGQASTISDLQQSVNNQLLVVSQTIGNFEMRLETLEQRDTDISAFESRMATLETAFSTLQDSNNTLLDFYNALSLGNVLSKDADGNLDLSNGKIKARELSTGALAIEIIDGEAPTIGSALLLPGAIDVEGATDSDGNDVPDGLDDLTGKPMTDPEVVARDGKSIVVQTKAVSIGSRVFVTPKQAVEEPLAVTRVSDGSGFTVEVKNAVSRELPFDWFIVEEK